MLEPVSTTVGICWLSYAALSAYARPGSAVSSEAQTVSKAAAAIVELTERSHALFGDKAAAISHLIALGNECAEAGWDGDEASAIDPTAMIKAKEFVRAIPDGVPLPEFAPEPGGSVSLDWIQSRHRRFTLSIGGSNRVAYAWLDGADKGHGVARFDGANIPPRVLEGILSIINHANASLRAA